MKTINECYKIQGNVNNTCKSHDYMSCYSCKYTTDCNEITFS